MIRTSLAYFLFLLVALGRLHAATLTLTAPLDYQVVQRETRDRGNIAIEGRLVEVETKDITLEARIVRTGTTGEWRKLPVTFTGERFLATMGSPAGGWYRVEVRALSGDSVLAGAAVEHVGVGEVFVVAGQSNAANYGEERQSTKSGQVVTFDGEHWQLGNDPQPGAGGAGGSFLPPFGDAMAQRFGVPVGFVACGIGATSVREWLPKGAGFPNPPTLTGRVQQLPDGQWEGKGEAFDMLVARMRQMGPRGFRAVLWHQGESDANQPDPARTLPGRLYYEYLKNLIRESGRALGWEPPWFVAQVSYHVPGDEASPDIRAAQASLWTNGVALAGPDSDALKGDLRENEGKGVHFSGPGLRAHAACWVDKVAPWLERSVGVMPQIAAQNSGTIANSAPDPSFEQAAASGVHGGQKRARQGEADRRWTPERAWTWYNSQPWLVGCNFVPSTAVNDVEMWQKGTFDAKTIDRELGWAQELGFNTVRVFVNYAVWEADAAGLKDNFRQFLKIAHKHGISTLVVLFDDCFKPEPCVGKQPDPEPGVHNSQWVQSPGAKRREDRAFWPKLEQYVKNMVGTFGKDKRVLAWELYNEPSQSLPLVEAAFQWAREARPSQPVTTTIFGNAEMQKRIIELSDVLCFHDYGPLPGVKAQVASLLAHGRPLLCTEWMARGPGSRFETHLPFFKENKIACWNWGLVAGRTQTYFPWGSPKGAPEPTLWHHDILRADGTPFRAREVAFLKVTTGKLPASALPQRNLLVPTAEKSPVARHFRQHRLNPVPIQQVVIQVDFWSPKLKVWREVTIADCFTKFENDRGGAINNFDRVRDGQTGGHAGPEWYDGLIYEMIRGSADFLASCPDAELEKRLDGYIDRIAAAAAKDPDGYLNTWTQLMAPTNRWGLNGGNDVQQHDVYNASAMVEAAVHYYRATGKTRLLQVATKLANHMADVMGPLPKQNIVPGHSLGEEALVKLYLLFRERPELKSRMPVSVEEQRYLKLAEFWIENRGNHEGRQSYGAYAQDHKPVLQQETIEGHAVRATLLCAGLVAAATADEREDYLTAARRLWNNMVERRMYVIGGLGAVAGHEGFGPDYVLPNNGYLETCAAIGAGFFHENMNLAFADARYADELERVLYNGILSGVSLKGDTYFYENPLEAGKNRTRWEWHGCPCCPPMFLKIMGALPGYIYAQDQGGVYVNLFVGSQASLTVNGAKCIIRQTTRYPWEGAVRLAVEPERETEFAMNVRLPAWCAEPQLKVNGKPLPTFERVRGYACLQRKWRRGDRIDLALPMPVQRIKASPQVEADIGRVALQRGPIVYCLEAVDNGGQVRNLVIPPDAQLKAQYRADLLGGVTVITGPALGLQRMEWRDTLYLPFASMPGVTNVEFTAIPYFANANRQAGEMMVWMADTANQAEPLPSSTPASRAIPSASHCWQSDTVSALNDQIEPAGSDDMKIPRFTWWDHRGTQEWVQYDFEHTEKVSAVQVYWWDERRLKAHCRVPQSWRLLYQTGGEWKPVTGVSDYTTEMDRFNRVTFAPVETKALRIEVQLQPEWSGGILEWRIESPGT